MQMALESAREAYKAGDIPIGAVVVVGDSIVAQTCNEKEQQQDATAHAELIALRQAARNLQRWRLNDATLYCTLEPCAMCAGAMVNARLGRLVYGARDSKAGAAGSILDVVRFPGLNHHIQVVAGVLEGDCACLLNEFFKDLRRDGRAGRRRSTRNRVGG